MDQDGEQDGGGRVGVSMSRMTVARGSVSMSRRVPYHDRLCAREVRLQGEAESAATLVLGVQQFRFFFLKHIYIYHLFNLFFCHSNHFKLQTFFSPFFFFEF